MWWWWVVAGLVMIIAEVLSLNLVLVMFGLAALCAGLVAALGVGPLGQLLVFVGVTVALLFAARPWLLEHLRLRKDLPETNVYAQVGKPAVAVTEVGPGGGRVKLDGEVWTARTEGGVTLPIGAPLEVVAIDGATAVVKAATPVRPAVD